MVIGNEYVPIDVVIPQLRVTSRKQLFQILAQKTAEKTGLGSYDLMNRLWEQERQASSGVGDGLAIPHMRVWGLKKPFTLFARLSGLIDFEALDGEPVGMVFLILSPEREDKAYHLRRLAHISRLLRDENMRKALHNAYDEDSVQVMFFDPASQPLAA